MKSYMQEFVVISYTHKATSIERVQIADSLVEAEAMAQAMLDKWPDASVVITSHTYYKAEEPQDDAMKTGPGRELLDAERE